MPRSNSLYPSDWLRIAQKDIERVNHLLEVDDPEAASFFLQQAVEKFLKAFLLSKGWKLQRVHDLEVLLNEALTHEPSFGQFRAACQKITQYYISDRYPLVSHAGLSEADVRDSLRQAKGLIEMVERELADTYRNKPEIELQADRDLARIVNALRHITDVTNNDWICVFSVGECYIQFALEQHPDNPDIPLLHGEAISNEFLSEERALTEAHIAKLPSMGWSPPGQSRLFGATPNFSQSWEETNDALLLQIGRDVLRAFSEVYGASPQEELKVELS